MADTVQEGSPAAGLKVGEYDLEEAYGLFLDIRMYDDKKVRAVAHQCIGGKRVGTPQKLDGDVIQVLDSRSGQDEWCSIDEWRKTEDETARGKLLFSAWSTYRKMPLDRPPGIDLRKDDGTSQGALPAIERIWFSVPDDFDAHPGTG